MNELQKQFLGVAKKMAETNTPFPDKFTVYYRVMAHHDRKGLAVAVRAFPTEAMATQAQGEDEEWEGKYGSHVAWFVKDWTDDADLENVVHSNPNGEKRSCHETIIDMRDFLY